MRESTLVAVLIVTHGGLAAELLQAAQTITGCPLENFVALALPWSVGAEEAHERIARAVAEQRAASREILILTDVFGDTPSKAAFACRKPGEVEVVSGVNLPMVVRLGCLADPHPSVAGLARWIQAKGRRSIRRSAPPDAEVCPARKP